ncbi:MAG: ATP-grasp fold amidoligase family protein [Eubacteriales bacterium]|nr:ATP-grasp fold amidoligase family protein [Eubacteriales bacterium]
MIKIFLIKRAHFIPDKLYLKIVFFMRFHRMLSFKRPETLNEKLQWLKIYDRRPEYTKLVDKYEVRKVIADAIGEDHLIPLLGVWDSADEIDYDRLPNQFVLKCTHDSKSIVICKDKKNFDFEAAKKKLNKKLKTDFYLMGREWPYKDVKPRIIAEKYMVDESGVELKDYKIMCFNGNPDNMMVCYNRTDDHTDFKFFDLSWNWLNYICGDEDLGGVDLPEKPKGYNEMMTIARQLSRDYYFTRIDLYDINGHIYFGEITLHPASGLGKVINSTADRELGKKLILPLLDEN